MKILITAGGTRTPIDEVRWVGNVSRGRFGAQIARAALAEGEQVVLFHAQGAELPTELTIDLCGDLEKQWSECRRQADRFAQWSDRYRAVPFADCDEYALVLEKLLREEPFDVVFLVAAVSDYAPVRRPGKIDSEASELVVRMTRVPKLISRVKDWAPNVFQVGFKLLVGVSREELIQAALESGRANRSDVTIANDLELIRQGNHTIHLVRDGHPAQTFVQADRPAEKLVQQILGWYRQEPKR